MSEGHFRDRLHRELENDLPNYTVEKSANLLYKLFIDAQGELQPANFANPKRGQLAFQTDILIKNAKVPLVVIEIKYGGFSTHDILTYSAKALRHKEVYPYVRYGLVVGGANKIDRKFFTHNSGFDFAIAISNEQYNFEELVNLIKEQLHVAECMLDVLKGNRKVRKYISNIEFG